MTWVVGLTGGIGSGKSAAADLFATHGIPVIDTDAIAHALTKGGGAAMPLIRAGFGDAVVAADGALDRAAMRAMVFADESTKNPARKRLEAILHPLIRGESERQLTAAASTAPYAILVVPLLIESGDYRKRVNRIAVVDCAEATQITRVMSRSGLARPEIERILAAQATRSERRAAADDWLRFALNWVTISAIFSTRQTRDHLRIPSQRARSHAIAARRSF